MKYYKILFTLFCLICSFDKSVAQANYASVTNFEILPEYLTASGKVKINPLSPTTTIKYKVSFVRVRGQWNSWQEADMIVGLVSASMNEATVFNGTKYINNASFPQDVAYLNDVIVTAVLVRSKLGFGKIDLMYTHGPTFNNTQRYYTNQRSYDSEDVYPPQGSTIASTDYNKRYVVPGYPGREQFNANTTVAVNGSYHLEMQGDGNLVLYNGSTPLWASGKKRGTNNAHVLFHYSGVGTFLGTFNYWNSSLIVGTRPVWVLQDDGNFVGYTNYFLDTSGNITITGTSFGATMTQGGQKSNRSGRLN